MEASKLRITPAFWETARAGSGGSHDNPTDIYEVTNHYTRICEYCTEADAKLIVEAGNTYHETGKTPRQLAEENARLRAALEELVIRCDGAEGVREDGSNIQTIAAHAALGHFEEE